MRIEYDPLKREQTLLQRGMDFECSAQVFEGLHMTAEDIRQNYDETRWITVGVMKEQVVVLVWTQRGEMRRIISMRRANEREKAHFQKYMG